MKKNILALCCLLFAINGMAQIQAVTSNGDEVVLYNDGTWKYVKKNDENAVKIDTNRTAFLKSKEAAFLVKSNIVPVGVYLNSKKWSFKKADRDGEAEYSFQLKSKDGYGMMMAERVEIPLESLRNIALENAKEASPDVKITHEEYRNVNGVKVLCMQMDGTIQGIKFSYLGYYFSFEKGTIQFITYTAQSLLSEYRQDMEELLNGFVLVK
ncbi:MAG TPA: hypothetical protein DCQ97_06990 [Chitinophagaceae bacterium]|nr:hypothetical protein [Chitinophagaceae bacterium]